ncbi:phospholipid/cholesterol/gamma-HCH transport system substrate-binding protein [Mycobacterium sp. BK086]|uniref:MCE family protein n=1 Tax=Mycobacterium sp. BK086 TaxID=2512165 RepID=UPI00105CE5CD|nr:MCE family protein [Mycobacterium sp. BK086]TDO06989.1 phospholipid/cholesterol/gamma-HCH transport system substrate-binding protein [Mycobacterium sp. BK086]
MSRSWVTVVKFGIYVTVMALLTASLFFIFGQYRTGAANTYSAVFTDASRLKTGDTVRAAGIQVGTVRDVSLQPDGNVLVGFDADPTVALTAGSRASVRYLNLVGDRYLDLTQGTGSGRILPPGAQISLDHTTPALDLDLLLGGLKPVIQGLNPQDVNALTASLLQVLQGQGDTLASLLANTSSFSNSLADNGAVIDRLITNLNTVMATMAKDGNQFGGALDRLERLTTELSQQRDPIGSAIDALDSGTASITDLLTSARPPLAATVDQLNRLAPLLDERKDLVDVALQRAPENYRKLARLGSYGSWINYYLCGISVRVTDLQGRTAVFPWIKQEGGRCAES